MCCSGASVLLGAIDLVLALLLGLGMMSLYPLVRFRAALGLYLLCNLLAWLWFLRKPARP